MGERLPLPGGGHLAFDRRGSGPPLVLVSGLGGAASFWGGFAQACARHFTVLTYDHRGTGRSSRCDTAYSVPGMARDLGVLLDGLGWDRVALVGHSTGGAIGQVMAIEEPGRIARLVLSATWARPCPYFRRLFSARLEVLERLGIEAYRRQAALVLNTPSWVAAHEGDIEADLAAARAAAHPLDAEITRRRIRAILDHDVLGRLGEVRCPTLAVVAQDDMVTPPHLTDAFSGSIADLATIVLPRGGHYLVRAEPEAYAGAVLPFLTA
jgi:aminoacrylate hydrolase